MMRVRGGTKRAPNTGATIEARADAREREEPLRHPAFELPDGERDCSCLADHPGNAFDEAARVLDQRADHPRDR